MNNFYQPLRFYTSLSYQERYSHAYGNYKTYNPIIVSKTSLVPFIIKRQKPVNSQGDALDEIQLTSILVKRLSDNSVYDDITENLSIDYGVGATTDGYATDYALYRGGSIIPSLPQGLYYLHITDSNGNNFYSEQFNVKFPQQTVKIEFRNKTMINDFWFYGSSFHFHAEYEGVVNNSGEYDVFQSIVSNIYNQDVPTFQRVDELLSFNFLGDQNALGTLQAARMCDTIYITDHRGERKEVKITNVNSDRVSGGNHIEIELQFRYVDETRTTEDKAMTFIKSFEGTTPKVKDKRVFRHGRFITRGNKRIIR